MSKKTSSSSGVEGEGNIQTFLRIKPSKRPSGYFAPDELSQNSLVFTLPDNFKSDYINNSKLKHGFQFNGVIDASAKQDEVFKRVGASAVQNAIDGFNSTIFAYGQTGSGKTFTLTGGPDSFEDRGIIPRAISMLFAEFRARTDAQFKIYVSYLELYNEQGYDLLDQSKETKNLEDLPKVSMLEDEHGNFHLKNLSMHAADNETTALNLLFDGDMNRAIAETPMNMASSRSHCIFTISIEAKIIETDKIRRSKLHLVDLAGSERVNKTNSHGSVLTEAKYINSSLFFLEMVIVALHEKATKGRTHIPYRNSMMTSVLRDSLGGNCRTIMVATINPEAAHTDESLSTCRFAQRVSLIKNKAMLNEEMDPSSMIKRLKAEILTLREDIAFLKGEAGEGDVLSPVELEDLKNACRTYCFDPNPNSTLNIGTLSLTKIQDAFAVMKNLVLEVRADRMRGGGVGDDTAAGTGTSGGATLGSEEQQKQIKDLKSLMVQRDNEIAILVNMVKKGKTANDVGQASSRGGSSGRASVGEGSGRYNEGDNDREGNTGGGMNSSQAAAAFGNSGGAVGKQQQQKAHSALAVVSREEQQKAQSTDRLIKTHLYGVPPPNEKAVFDDAAASFEWFRGKSQLNEGVVRNKEQLRDKISEAKAVGERANQSRSTINYLKNSIESIRRERALSTMDASGDAAVGGDDAKDAGSGTEGGGSSGGGGEKETAEETTYRRAIEQEKTVYKESFERLRLLKPEIEYIRKNLEKSRLLLQSQFDQWYTNLHSKSNMVTSAHNSAYSGGGGGYSIGAEAKQQEEQQQPQPRRYEEKQSSSQAEAVPRRPQVQDEDVNEDIMAFYQAKEELLKRRNGGGGGAP